jgi:protein ImuB
MHPRYACLTGERSAQAALLDLALAVSPRVEDGGAGFVSLDLSGLEILYRDESRLAEDLIAHTVEAGFDARVAIASTRTAARLAAATHPLAVIASGDEARFLAPLSIALLECSPEIARVLAQWGIRTLGDLAALPEAGLVERLGEEGRRLQREARGEDLRPLIPYRIPARDEEAMDLEWPIESLDALAFVLGGLLDRFFLRLASRGWAVGLLHLVCGLVDRTSRDYALPLASPLEEGRAALPLLMEMIRSNPPPAAIETVSVRADPVSTRTAQGSLLAPATISPEKLAAMLARTEALVGPGQVGSPTLLNSHRPDAFRLDSFVPGPSPKPRMATSVRGPVLRRFRPPFESLVETQNGCPVRIVSHRISGRVRVCAGPWRSSSEWWTETEWSRDEWDVELDGGCLVRLVFDVALDTWFVEGTYD